LAVEYVLSVLKRVCFLSAGDAAVSAAYASFRVEHDFWFWMDAFGVLAPEASESAAFQEDSCSDTWTIVNREPLYIEDYSFHKL
jgi:hypothetical protein